jgi:hypothetical protein
MTPKTLDENEENASPPPLKFKQYPKTKQGNNNNETNNKVTDLQ